MLTAYAHILYAILISIYFLTFGVFNSVLREYHRVWIHIILSVSVIPIFIYGIDRLRKKKGISFGGDVFLILTAAYTLCLCINAATHYMALKELIDPFYLNVRLMTPKDWIGANLQFFVYYLFFPVLLTFHRLFLYRCDAKTILRITAIILSVSMIVLFYQALFDNKLLAKWSVEANYKKPDGLATDPNAYIMCAVLMIPFFIINIFAEDRRSWRCFFLFFSILYAVSGILTGSRTGIATILLLILSIPVIVAAVHVEWGRTRRLMLLVIPFLFIILTLMVFPHVLKICQSYSLGDGFNRLIRTLNNIREHSLVQGLIKDNFRALQFVVAWILIRQAPFGGWGPGGFYREFPNIYYLQTGDFTFRNDSALNHYLMIAGDLGIPVLILNLLIIGLPLLAVVQAMKRTNEKRARYVFATLFAVQVVFLLMANTLPPSYFPDVIWVWTGIMVFSISTADRQGLSFTVQKRYKRLIYILILGIVIIPNGIGIYAHTFGEHGFSERRDAIWNPMKFERNCYYYEHWEEQPVRWCKTDAVLKIPLTEEMPTPEQIQLKVKLLHPDIRKNPVWIKYGTVNTPTRQVEISDHRWHTLDIRIKDTDTITIPALPEGEKAYHRFFKMFPADYEAPALEKVAQNYFFHGYKFSQDWTPPDRGIHRYALVRLDVSRTWRPKEWHVNDDTRELGIAVQIPKL